MRLGELGLGEFFRLKGDRAVYQTITNPKSRVNHSVGTRWCQNVETLKSKWMYCRERVIKVSRGK